MREKQHLIDLALRCEAATEYDGRLMAEIDCAVRYPGLRPAEPDDHPSVKDHTFDPSAIWTPTGWLMSHNYFRSADVAMALIPDGWWLAGLYFCPPDFRSEGDREWHAEVHGPITWVTLDHMPEPQGDCEGGNAATAALALTAACLRALAGQP